MRCVACSRSASQTISLATIGSYIGVISPPGADAGVDAHAGARRLAVGADPARRGGEVLRRVLGVDAALDRVAAQHDVVLGDRQRLAGGDADALLDDVDAGRPSRSRSARPARACSSPGRSTRRPGAGPRSCRRRRSRRPRRRRRRSRRSARAAPRRRAGAGDSSISFWWRRWIEQSRSPRWIDVAVLVGEHLDLDVARVGQVALEVDGGVGEELLALARGALEGVLAACPRSARRGSPCRRRRPRP